jgi:hypothetical protein
MKTNLSVLAGLILLLGAAGTMGVAAEPEVEGVFGLAPMPEGAAIAVWVPLEEGETVEGVRWYHNDAAQAFPVVLAVAGEKERPELIPQAVVVATEAGGPSLGWSELEFAQPLASVTEGLYLVFRLPEDGEMTAEGLGGGAGLGYRAGTTAERRCWVTFEGEVWHPVSPEYEMAVSAVMGAAKSGQVLVLGHPSAAAEGEADEESGLPRPLVASLRAVPNPFNPQTEVRFTLPRGGRAVVSVYDIRGRLVRRLHEGELAAGEHTAVWDGRDRQGRQQPSGVYVARLEAGSLKLSSRLTLVQ